MTFDVVLKCLEKEGDANAAFVEDTPSPLSRLYCSDANPERADEITIAAAETSILPPLMATSSCSLSSLKNSTSLAVHRVPSSAGLRGCVVVIRRRFADQVWTVLVIRDV